MTYLRLCSVVVLSSCALGLAGVASAQTPKPCRIVLNAGMEPQVVCDTTFTCSGPDECIASFGPDAVCDVFTPLDVNFCRARCSTLLGCGSSGPGGGGQCPMLPDGGIAECRSIGQGTATRGHLCLYPALGVHYCTDAGDTFVGLDQFLACHRTVQGDFTNNYFEGNCDGDRCPNGADVQPCLSDRAPCAADPDLGPLCQVVSSSDAGVPVTPDAGSAMTDAAPPEQDAGAIDDEDAGSPEDVGVGDGGEPAGDAGSEAADASILAPDGGVDTDAGLEEPVDAAPFDAGPPPPPQVSFNGGGGCRCAAPGAGDGSQAPGAARGPLALMALLGVFAFRRRRSRG